MGDRLSSAEKDFYRILGVIDSAELAVIKAAYKALIMIYHPDRNKGNEEKSVRKSKEINEAYAVLSDPDKRKKYDDERSARKNQYEPEQEEKGFSTARNDALESDWNIAIEHVKGLDELYKYLNIMSEDLAFTFKLEILETKQFDRAKPIADKFQSEFLKKFFGADKGIQDFSYWLLTQGKREIAKEINKIVVVLGDSLVANDVIETIVKKYNLTDYEYKINGDKKKSFYSEEESYRINLLWAFFAPVVGFIVIGILVTRFLTLAG
jgi:curved DNA-binding protein CbpA